MKLFRIAGLTAIAAFCASVAHGAQVKVGVFEIGAFTDLTKGWVIEDFENTPATLTVAAGGGILGTLDGPLTSSLVGEFSTTGGLGTGGTCNNNNKLADPTDNSRKCTEIARYQSPPDTFGQGNLFPTDGDGRYSLNSNDTTGIQWVVGLQNNQSFTEVAFGIQDPADQRAEVKISSDEFAEEYVFSNLGNADAFLVHIMFDSAVTGATITIQNQYGVTNDAFSIDPVAVNPVPLPAAVWLFGSALLGAGVIGRRKRQA